MGVSEPLDTLWTSIAYFHSQEKEKIQKSVKNQREECRSGQSERETFSASCPSLLSRR